jgi:chromosome segregation ATPase
MWNTAKQLQLDELRQREQEGTLTGEEREALEQLLHEIEQEEWATLQPTLGRLRQEQKQLQEECGRLRTANAILAALAERYEDLLARARVQLAGLLSEHEALKTEYERVTGQPLVASSS